MCNIFHVNPYFVKNSGIIFIPYRVPNSLMCFLLHRAVSKSLALKSHTEPCLTKTWGKCLWWRWVYITVLLI